MKPSNEIAPSTTDNSPESYNAFLHQAHMTPRWAAILGILAIGVLYMLLPPHLIIGPNWLLLVIELVLLLPIILSWMTHRILSHRTIHFLVLTLLSFVTLALAIGIALLILTLPGNTHAQNLLRSAGLLWCFNILVFALWYFEIDGGGPLKRHLSSHQAVDFMFPQQVDGNSRKWVAHFVDYLFLAFTAATALSPADTYPLTRKAKALMMIEAILSLVVIVLLAARAVNILQ